MPGIMKSSRMRSGPATRASSRPVSPFSAVLTSKPACRSTFDTTRRMVGESSTTRTRGNPMPREYDASTSPTSGDPAWLEQLDGELAGHEGGGALGQHLQRGSLRHRRRRLQRDVEGAEANDAPEAAQALTAHGRVRERGVDV